MARTIPNREALMREARARWALGAKGEHIAKDLGLKPSTVRGWAERNHWDADRGVGKAVAIAGGAIPSLAHDLLSESTAARVKLSAVVTDQISAVGGLQPGKDPAKVHRRAQALRETVNAASVVYGWNTQDQLAAWATISKRQPEVKRVGQDGTVESVLEPEPA